MFFSYAIASWASVVVVVVYPHLPDLWEVSAHSTEVTGSTCSAPTRT